MPPQTSPMRTARGRYSPAEFASGRRLLLRSLRRLMPSLAHRREKLPALVEHPLGFFHRRHHLLHRFEDVLGAEVEAAIEALNRAVNLLVGQARISDRALLVARFVEQRIDRQESI